MITHPNVQVPPRGPIYSINEGNSVNWDAATKKWVGEEGGGRARSPSGRVPSRVQPPEGQTAAFGALSDLHLGRPWLAGRLQVCRGMQGRHVQQWQAVQPALRGVHGSGRAPHLALRRNIHVPCRQEEPPGARWGGATNHASTVQPRRSAPSVLWLDVPWLCCRCAPSPAQRHWCGPRAVQGKLRVLYECFPMAMLVEQAGGKATTGTARSLEMTPDSIHGRRVPQPVAQHLALGRGMLHAADACAAPLAYRAPIYLGSKDEVELIEKYKQEAAAQ